MLECSLRFSTQRNEFFNSFQVEFDHESGLPTDKLNETARAVCGSMNVRATTVSDINSTKDGEKVLKLIQSAIDRANEKATAKHHKVRVC